MPLWGVADNNASEPKNLSTIANFKELLVRQFSV